MLLLALLLLATPDPPGLQAAAEAALAERFPAEAHRLEPRVLRSGGGVPTEGGGGLRVSLPAGGGVPKGHAQVDVLAPAEGGGWQRAGWALLYVAHHDSVLVPTQRLSRGEPVPEGALSVAWIETTRFPGEPLRPADLRALTDQGGGVVAERLLAAERPLRRGDLAPPPAAAVGDAVTLRFARGTVAMELPCRAREAGRPGDAVRLHCPDTGALYRARLTEPGRADWLETLRR